MKMCPDGNPCDTWFGADGCLICRHGLVAEASDTTAVNWENCPGRTIDREEREMLRQFIKDMPDLLPKILRSSKLRSSNRRVK